MWASFSTRPRRYSGHGFSYVATDLGDVSEGEGWVNPFDPQAAFVKEQLAAEMKKIADEIAAEAAWSDIEDRIDRQIASNFPGKAPAKHVCPVPEAAKEDQFTKNWECPECKQRWRKPAWYSAYQPVSE